MLTSSSLFSLIVAIAQPACLPSAPPDPGSISQALVGDVGTDDGGLPPDLAAPPAPPSSRLRAMTWQSGGFTIAVDGFYDKTLNTRCTPARSADGSIRCIPYPWLAPGGEDAPAYDASYLIAYGDSTCTDKLVNLDLVRPSFRKSEYLLTVIGQPYGVWYEVYRVGPSVSAPSACYFMSHANICTACSSVRAGNYHSVERIPPSMLADMSLQ